jgi:hypothetical protein
MFPCEDKFWISPMPPATIAIVVGIFGLLAMLPAFLA